MPDDPQAALRAVSDEAQAESDARIQAARDRTNAAKALSDAAHAVADAPTQADALLSDETEDTGGSDAIMSLPVEPPPWGDPDAAVEPEEPPAAPEPAAPAPEKKRTAYVVLREATLIGEDGQNVTAYVPVADVDDHSATAARKAVFGSLVEHAMREDGATFDSLKSVDGTILVAIPASSFQPKPCTLDLKLSVG